MTKGIYAYIDKKNNKIIYVGKDSHIDDRRRDKNHKQPWAYNKQQINRVIQNTPERYQYKVLEEGNISGKILNALERSFIQKYNPKFNYTEGGEGILGFKHSNKTKKKISESLNGKYFSEEHKEKISKATSKSLSIKRNTTGYYRVIKRKSKNTKQGFSWYYRWYDKDGKRKTLSSVNIQKLEEKVKEKGLPWFKIEEEK